MKLVVHKGAQEIGGTCIELSHQGTTILLDIGEPLKKGSKPADLTKVKPDAVILSHPHQDHYGLLDRLPPGPRIFAGELGWQLMEAASVFCHKGRLKRSFSRIVNGQEFAVGPFRITPHLMDHSAAEAFAFTVRAGGKVVVYSGDFRAHGTKRVLFDRFLAAAPRQPDALLMEGTTLGREPGKYRSETAVREEFIKIFRTQKNISFIICSGQNIDRLVSIYRACRKTGKQMVIDPYIAWVLDQFRPELERGPKNVPNVSGTSRYQDLRMVNVSRHRRIVEKNPEISKDFLERAKKSEIEEMDIECEPARYVWVSRVSDAEMINNYLDSDPVNLVYSQWSGYLEDFGKKGVKEIKALRTDPRVNYADVHTSGHASLATLKKLARTLNPKRLIPVHTEAREEYHKHFENVAALEDQEELLI